jgi:ABC-type amino acid transport substrate-binding protein
MNVDFSIPYLQDGQSCIVKVDAASPITPASWARRSAPRPAPPAWTPPRPARTEQCVRYTKALDAVMDLQATSWTPSSPTPVAKRILKELGDDTLAISDTVVFDAEYYGIAIPKGNTDLKAKIDASIERMQADGTIDALVVKWDIYGENAASDAAE